MSNTPVASPGPEKPVRKNHWIDLTPLRTSPAFARLWAGNLIAGIGSQVTLVAVGLHVYALTASTFAVGMVGVIALIPMIFGGMYGGVLADRFDRRTIMVWSAVFAWLSTAGLAALAWCGVETVWPYYLFATTNSVAGVVLHTVRSSVIPRIVPRPLLASASALHGASFGTILTVGPALAGVLVASVGYSWTYTVDVVLFSFGFLGIVTLPYLPAEGPVKQSIFRSFKEGLVFLKNATNLRTIYIIDIMAMTFGNVRSLLPALGALVLGGGAVTVGVLISAQAIGTLISSLFSGQAKNVHRHAVAVERAVMSYGGFVFAFGVLITTLFFSGNTGDTENPLLWAIALSCLFMGGMGASDNVSSIFRATMMQMATPDRILGRLQGIYTVVIHGGPRVGDFYISLVGGLLAVWAPPLFGGIAIVVLVITIARMSTGFREYDARNPTP